jgi:hypothetical protein
VFRCDLLIEMDAVLVIADDEADPLDQNWIIDTIIEGRGHADALDVPLLVDLREAQLTGTRDIHAWSCDLVRLSAGDTVSHVRWPGEPRAEPFAEGAPLRPPQSAERRMRALAFQVAGRCARTALARAARVEQQSLGIPRGPRLP